MGNIKCKMIFDINTMNEDVSRVKGFLKSIERNINNDDLFDSNLEVSKVDDKLTNLKRLEFTFAKEFKGYYEQEDWIPEFLQVCIGWKKESEKMNITENDINFSVKLAIGKQFNLIKEEFDAE